MVLVCWAIFGYSAFGDSVAFLIYSTDSSLQGSLLGSVGKKETVNIEYIVKYI